MVVVMVLVVSFQISTTPLYLSSSVIRPRWYWLWIVLTLASASASICGLLAGTTISFIAMVIPDLEAKRKPRRLMASSIWPVSSSASTLLHLVTICFRVDLSIILL